MARATLSSPVSSITGTFGHSKFRVTKGITTISRPAVTMKNCNSPAQGSSRSNLTTIAKAWRGLTSPQRSLWNEYAKQTKRTLPGTDLKRSGGGGLPPGMKRSLGIMSGFNSFVSLHVARYSVGMTKIEEKAPKGCLPLHPPHIYGCSYSSHHQRVDFYLQCQPPLNPQRGYIRYWTYSRDAGVHSQHLRTTPYCQWHQEVTHVRVSCGRSVPLWQVPGHYKFWLDVVGRDGLVSLPSNVCYITVPNYALP